MVFVHTDHLFLNSYCNGIRKKAVSTNRLYFFCFLSGLEFTIAGLNRSFCFFYHNRESFGIANCQIGQDFAVQLDVRFFHAIDKLAVGQSVGTGGCVDAGDPQFAQVAFTGAAGRGRHTTCFSAWFSLARLNKVLRVPKLPLLYFKNFLVSQMGYGSTFYTGHNSLLCVPLGAGYLPVVCTQQPHIKLLTIFTQIRRQTIDALGRYSRPSTGTISASNALVRRERLRRKWLFPPLVRTSLPETCHPKNALLLLYEFFSFNFPDVCFLGTVLLLLLEYKKNIA